MTRNNAHPRRGDFCAVEVAAHDRKPKIYTLRRVVRATRDGLITHVATEQQFGPQCRANAGNKVRSSSSSAFVTRVLTLPAALARNPAMATLANGDGYFLDAGDAFEDIDGLRAAVRKAATQNNRSHRRTPDAKNNLRCADAGAAHRHDSQHGGAPAGGLPDRSEPR